MPKPTTTGRIWLLAIGSTLVGNCSSDAGRDSAVSAFCVECQTLPYIVTIGSDSDPASTDTMFPTVARDPRGHWYVLDSSRSEILVYAPGGEYLRTIGRAGDGPGELRLARYIMATGDSVLVFSGGRYTTFDSAGNFIQTTPLPALATRAYLSGGGDLVIRADIPERGRSGHPLHKILDGEVVASFGANEDSVPVRHPTLPATSSAGNGLFWIAQQERYRLELWSIDGALIRVVDQRRPWFEWPQDRIKAYVADIWTEPEDSVVWTSVVHAHQATSARPTFVSVVEAININTGNVMARDSVVDHRLLFTNDGHLFSAYPAESGNIVVSLWRRPTVSHGKGDSR